MSTPAIKICGIREPNALEAAIGGGAAHAGFVFFAKSPRHVDLAEAAALSARAAGRIGRVGLFVNATDAEIAAVLAVAQLDALQLHGEEPPARAGEVRARFGLPVWKAIPVAGPGDVERAAAFRGAADLILFDAKTPKGTLPGGMGLAFDWGLVAGWRANGFPGGWGLAGGLAPGNVAQAVARTGTPLVDCSSGVESAAGVKDAGLIEAFCKAVRG